MGLNGLYNLLLSGAKLIVFPETTKFFEQKKEVGAGRSNLTKEISQITKSSK